MKDTEKQRKSIQDAGINYVSTLEFSKKESDSNQCSQQVSQSIEHMMFLYNITKFQLILNSQEFAPQLP